MNPFPAILQTIVWIPTRLALIFFTHLKIRGLENLKDVPQGVIFASNHSNWLDPILLPASLPFFSRFTGIHYVSLTKNEYQHLPFGKYLYGGLFFKAWGAYPAYRGLGNYENSLRHHISFLNHHKSVMMFPEGKRTKEGEWEPAKPGIAYLAEITNRPIVPFTIEGTAKLTLLTFFTRKQRLTVTFGQPLTYAALSAKYTDLPEHERNIKIAEEILTKIKGNLGSEPLAIKVRAKKIA